MKRKFKKRAKKTRGKQLYRKAYEIPKDSFGRIQKGVPDSKDFI